MNKYIIYAHKNKINKKMYIGQTCQSPAKRWGMHGQRYKNQVFYNAILKYGWDNFEHIILEKGLSKDEANKREQYYIQKYKTTDKQFGYNITIRRR